MESITENPMEEILKLTNKLPLLVLQDINQRLTDHASMGGLETDYYVHQQLRYARNVIAAQKEKASEI